MRLVTIVLGQHAVEHRPASMRASSRGEEAHRRHLLDALQHHLRVASSQKSCWERV